MAYRLSDIACRFICAYWRVSAGPCVKSSGNSPEAIHPLLWWKPSLKVHFLPNALQGYCWWWHISGVNIRKAPAVEWLICLIKICIGIPGSMLRPDAVRRVRFGCRCWRGKNAFDMNSLKRQLCHMDHMIITLLNEVVSRQWNTEIAFFFLLLYTVWFNWYYYHHFILKLPRKMLLLDRFNNSFVLT